MLSLVLSDEEDGPSTLPGPDSPGVNVWRSPDGEPVAFSSTTGDRRSLHWPGVATFHFDKGRDFVTAVPCKPVRADLIQETFRHSVLPLALQASGLEAIHASAVLTPLGVVGFCGRAETGKSTLAYAVSQRGYPAWSDDAVVFEIEGAQPRSLPLPFEFRLRSPSAEFFGAPARLKSGTDRDAGQRAPIAALCVLTREPATSAGPGFTISRLTGREALTAVLDHALCFEWHDTARKRELLINYLSLVAAIRVFDVRVQPSLERLSHVVDAVVERVIAQAQPRKAIA